MKNIDWFSNNPYEDIYKSFSEFDTNSIRAGVILISSIVEYFLDDTITLHLYGKDNKYNNILESCGVSTLSKKIKFAKTLQIINEETFRYLHALREARNYFAHNYNIITNQDQIQEHLKKLTKLLPIDKESIDFRLYMKGLCKLEDGSFVEIEPDTNQVSEWKDSIELNCQAVKVVYYFRYLHENMDKGKIPDCKLGLDYGDKINNIKDTTKCLTLNQHQDHASINFTNIITEHIRVEMIFHQLQSNHNGSLLTLYDNNNNVIINIKLLDESIIISTTIEGKLQPSLTENNTTESINISFSTNTNHIELQIGNSIYKIYADLPNTPLIKSLYLNSVINKEGKDTTTGQSIGIFYLNIQYKDSNKKIFSYSSNNNSDNRYLTKHGSLRGLMLTTPDVESIIGPGNHFLGIPNPKTQENIKTSA